MNNSSKCNANRQSFEGLVPEMCIWSILLINPILNGVYIVVEVSFYINNSSVSNKDSTYVTYSRKQIDKKYWCSMQKKARILQVVDVIQDY